MTVAVGVLVGGTGVAAGALITMGRWTGGASAMMFVANTADMKSDAIARFSFHMRGNSFS